jgi:hypothetical protein
MKGKSLWGVSYEIYNQNILYKNAKMLQLMVHRLHLAVNGIWLSVSKPVS